VGLSFQFSKASEVIPGAPRDAEYVVRHLLRRGEAVSRRSEAAVAA
jgi:hypothetical protein